MAVKAVACELPRTLELPLSRLFVPDIQKEVIRQGIVASISGSLRPAGGPGDEHRALRFGPLRLLDRRQWFVAARPGLHQTSGGALPEGGPPAAAADPLPGPRLVAEPDMGFYFSIIQRKVLTPNDFVDLEEV